MWRGCAGGTTGTPCGLCFLCLRPMLTHIAHRNRLSKLFEQQLHASQMPKVWVRLLATTRLAADTGLSSATCCEGQRVAAALPCTSRALHSPEAPSGCRAPTAGTPKDMRAFCLLAREPGFGASQTDAVRNMSVCQTRWATDASQECIQCALAAAGQDFWTGW